MHFAADRPAMSAQGVSEQVAQGANCKCTPAWCKVLIRLGVRQQAAPAAACGLGDLPFGSEVIFFEACPWAAGVE